MGWHIAHRVFLLLCLMVLSRVMYAQGGIVVARFEPSETAINITHQKQDKDGNDCALIVARTRVMGFQFSVGQNSICYVEEPVPAPDDDGYIYYINVAAGTRKLTIKNNNYGKPYEYQFPQKLGEGKVYEMLVMTNGTVQTIVTESAGKQFVMINVSPKNAIVEISQTPNTERMDNLFPFPLDASGEYQKLLTPGTYMYRATAEDYYESIGKFTIVSTQKTPVSIQLKPKFGYLELKGVSADASVIIGNKPYQMGQGRIRVSSGNHTLRIIRDKYEPFTRTITISDGETTTLEPKLVPNFAETTLIVPGDNEAEIYVDGEFKDKGKWTGPLEPGDYSVEIKKKNHHTQSQRLHISSREATTQNLLAPVPITSSLQIHTVPKEATVKIDGKVQNDFTPIRVNNILVGEHVVEVSKRGYKTEARRVTLKEGEENELTINLSSIGSYTFNSSSGYGVLYIDGKYKGSLPYTWEAPMGRYDIEISSYGYKTWKRKKYLLDPNHPNVYARQKRQLIKKSEFYIGYGGSVGAQQGVAATMGFYAGNFNMEADVKYSFNAKSEEIYWGGVSYLSGIPYEYKQSYIVGGRMGWGIICGTRFRITPQIGAYAVVLQEKQVNVEDYSEYDVVTNPSCATMMVGMRFMLGLSRHIGLAFVPEYMFRVAESPGHKSLSAVSPTIKKWSEGFNTNMYLTFYF